MVFSSYVFVFVFLPAVLVAYYLAPRKLKHLLLTLFSYGFYGWANPAFAFLMLFSTAVDYRCGLIAGRRDAGDGTRRAALVTSIVTNLGLLGFFKYANFGIDNYNALVTALGGDHLQWETFFRITLPLGISFYTFQSMSYTIDVYRRHAEPVRNFVDFACYVALFPQLVAGPIVRFREIADQLAERGHSIANFARGVSFFAFGMAKKILIANPCGKIADVCFEAGSLTVVDAWYGIVAYSFQIYFDFSAYSDMAIGLGLMLGFAFPKNFDSPYLSQSITEFWRRWHLSLSSFLRDYLYIPLGGNRKGERRTYVNLMTVMLLGGLWHGALWNFVIWGAIHGVMLAVERRFEKDSLYRRLPAPAKMLLTFLIVTIAWVFFRAPTLGEALDYLGAMVGLGPQTAGGPMIAGLIYQPYYLLVMAVAAGVVWLAPQTWDYTRRMTWPKAAWAAAAFATALAVMMGQAFNPFIYFIF
ncbi:MAG: MBOAT family protein [Gammaproteobacteria bacterium]|nr:MBOAT family protein [Gammaproteobacteria bacterium]